MNRFMPFFMCFLVASYASAASITSQQLKLGLVALLTFLVIYILVLWFSDSRKDDDLPPEELEQYEESSE